MGVCRPSWITLDAAINRLVFDTGRANGGGVTRGLPALLLLPLVRDETPTDASGVLRGAALGTEGMAGDVVVAVMESSTNGANAANGS